MWFANPYLKFFFVSYFGNWQNSKLNKHNKFKKQSYSKKRKQFKKQADHHLHLLEFQLSMKMMKFKPDSGVNSYEEDQLHLFNQKQNMQLQCLSTEQYLKSFNMFPQGHSDESTAIRLQHTCSITH